MRSFPGRGSRGVVQTRGRSFVRRSRCRSLARVPRMAEHELALPTAWGQLSGTLLLPEGEGPWPVALLVAGSGPTDRDGNSALDGLPLDSLKLLARGLAGRGIASLRYDKRGVGASR